MNDGVLVRCCDCEYAERHKNDYWKCRKSGWFYSSWGVDWAYCKQKCDDFKERR